VVLLAVLNAGAVAMAPGKLSAASPGEEVAVVFNSRVPESKDVADYYARRREVPAGQVFGLELPTSETLTRQEYLEKLQGPLLKKLEAEKLFVFGPATNRAPGAKAGEPGVRQLLSARIRYVVLCYGVPVRILKDPSLEEAAAAQLPPEMRRNEAAVDTQLALLPAVEQNLPWSGPLASPFYATTNRFMLQPTHGVLMVTRLDGPSAAIARRLVDQAIEAETNGWWGRAYFDVRGLGTNDSYRRGDDIIRGAAMLARQYGFETELDEAPETFSAGHPFSQVALYAGWYDQTVTGPFTRPAVEFMPGAFAYHLYSFSASTIRSAPNSWVGTLLEKGATCTMGSVDEPYLNGTPDILVFLSRFTFAGFSYGEAAYAAQGALSWQTTIIGDPLYRPCATSLEQLHRDLEKRKSKLLEWSHLLVVNRNQAVGAPVAELVRYVESQPGYRQSAVLTEKLGDLFSAKGALGDSIDSYEAALKRGPSPQQRVRLLIKCAEKRTLYGPDADALSYYETLLKENPDYPEQLKVYQAMLPLARRAKDTAAASRLEKEIARLTPPPSPAK
jgi:uncharacterized protein (TIGR03790 family)